jgi:hypothetical protein
MTWIPGLSPSLTLLEERLMLVSKGFQLLHQPNLVHCFNLSGPWYDYLTIHRTLVLSHLLQLGLVFNLRDLLDI